MTTDLFGTSPAIPCGTASSKHHGRRALTLGIAASAAIAMFLGGMGATASAIEDSMDTSASAVVEAGITMTGLTSSVTLTGTPGSTVVGAAAVAYNVETNNVAGYAVTVGTADSTLVPSDMVANTDTIPIGALTIREATGTYTPLNATTPVAVHSQAERSANLGDALSTNFQMRIPTVNADTYSATLSYVATTL